jgi:hypothetical protein
MGMAYADYAYYTGTYKGNVIPVSAFDRLALRASEFIDRVTQNQAATAATEYETKLKFACCAIAESMYKFDDTKGKTSESVTGQSVSYNTAEITQANYQACKSYLWDTGLLYSGV